MTELWNINRFRMVRLSKELQRQFSQPEIICADPEGQPFVAGRAFYAWLIGDNACQPATAEHYLRAVLPFLTFLWLGSPSLLYTASSQQIRNRIRDFLREKLGCIVRPHREGNLIVTTSPQMTQHSGRLFLSALRRFYDFAISRELYRDAHPLVWAKGVALREQAFTPTMPPSSGLTLPKPGRGRIPDTYFCFTDGDWRPHIIEDSSLPSQLYPAFSQSRDRIITRILFQSGARISEVLSLTIGDWRQCNLRDRALAKNKGSLGVRVKEIWWSNPTTQLLHKYVNGERRSCDPLHLGLDNLPNDAPLFVTDTGSIYHYHAFYYHWRKACQEARVHIHPHQARHWFVTNSLSLIQSLPNEDQRQAHREGLIAYMSWKSSATIQVYDHHIHLIQFAPLHTALAQLVEGELAAPSTQKDQEKGPLPNPSQIPCEMLERLHQLLNEDEEVL